jgi:ParB family transcriptional regulator, chromosome partitioning protein
MSVMSKTKSRLGRGLSSLMSISELPVEGELPSPETAHLTQRREDAEKTEDMTGSSQPTASFAPTEIPLDQVVPNPHQPRRQMNDSTIAELAASLKATGLIQPIIVRKVGDRYELIAGERRWRAARVAGLLTIPVLIRDVDSFTQAQMALVENIQRENLNPIDRAQAYRSLMTQLGLTQAELAGRLGEDRSTVANHLRLLELPEAVRTMVAEGRLSLGHAKIIAGVADVLEQQRLANLVISQELSVRNLEKLMQEGSQAKPAPKAASAPSAHTQDLEKSLGRQLGMRVQVKSKKNGKGSLVLHYATLDQFDELMSRMGLSVE